MRIFIGIQVTNTIQEDIIAWQHTYRQTHETDGIKWLHKKNLHITLLPPWYEDTVEKVITNLQIQPFHIDPFAIRYDCIRSVPHKEPKYMWAEGKRPDPILDLRNRIAGRLGREVEKREFRLHSTIARLQKDVTIEPLSQEIDWPMQVTAFALFQSHVSSEGAVYEVLKTFPLT